MAKKSAKGKSTKQAKAAEHHVGLEHIESAADMPPKATYEPAGASRRLKLVKTPQAKLPESRRGVKRVLLAYSGGLDTSVMIPWLIENYGCDVVAYAGDLGQGGDMKALKKKAKDTGAVEAHVADLRDEFVTDYIVPAIMANALYEGKYPMHTSLGRPLIAHRMVEAALESGCDALAHGCTGKGNDQCRFEFTFMALAPELRVIAPLREWEMKSRDDEFDYAEARGIFLPISREKPFSIDKNLYGCAIECGELEDPWHVAPDETFQDTKNPIHAPDKPEDVTVGFSHGVPSSLNGRKMKPRAIIEKLTEIGNRHSVGRIDMVENRLVGIKSREVYEAPAGVILIAAHRELEALCLDKETQRFKDIVDQKYVDIIYNGFWFSPLREALQEFIVKTNEVLTGEVQMRLYKGSCRAIARKSPNSLYDRKLATYEKDDEFQHADAEGFINIHGMPLFVHNRLRKRGIR